MNAHIIKAREIVRQIKDVSDKTAYKYIQRYNKIKNNDIIANTSNSFYNARAAFLYGARLELKALLTLRDKNVRVNNVTEVEKCDSQIKDIINKMSVFLDDKRSVSKNLEKVKTHQAAVKTGLAEKAVTWSSHKQDNNITVKKHSKRNDVKYWQDEFDNIFLNEIDEKYKDWLALMMLSGVRPDELDKNNISFRREDDVLAIQIMCSKQVKGKKRQEWRQIRIQYDASNVALAHLYKRSKDVPRNPKRPDCKNPAKAIVKALERISKRLKPKAPALTPYVYRHAFAANMKAAGIDVSTIAMALGHTNTKTQSYYGNKKNGKSVIKITSAASHDVNDNRHDYTPAAPQTTVSTNVDSQPPQPPARSVAPQVSQPSSPYKFSFDDGPGW